MRRIAASIIAVLALCLAGCGGGSHKTGVAASAQLHGGRTHSAQFVQQAQSTRFAPGQYKLEPSISGYDAVTISAIPRGAQAIGCYVSGPYANCGTARADFPAARLVTIATYATYPGPAKILDTEPEDAVPSEDAGFIRTQISVYHVYRPGIYADASEMTEVRADLNASGIARSSYVLMIAAWDGNPAIPTGYDAKQWRSTTSLDYDTFATSFFATPAPPGPSQSQTTHWRSARNSSFSAYHARRCTLGEAQAKGTPKACVTFAQRVVYFQQQLWTQAHVARWACWGKHARSKSLVCWVLRPEASYWSHARDASERAYERSGCDGPAGFPAPVHSPLCDGLRQRRGYFGARVKAARRTAR